MKTLQDGHVAEQCLEYLDLFSLRSSLRRHSAAGRIDRLARQWFVLQHSGAFTQTRQAEFERWINKDNKHLQVYQRYEKLWTLLGNFSENPEIRSTRLVIQSNR